jgi:hypothetical protein
LLSLLLLLLPSSRPAAPSSLFKVSEVRRELLSVCQWNDNTLAAAVWLHSPSAQLQD